MDNVPSSGTLLASANEVVSTSNELYQSLANQAQQVQDQLTTAFDAVNTKATAESVGASAEVQTDIREAVNQANHLYDKGISELSEAVEGAKELHDERSGSDSN